MSRGLALYLNAAENTWAYIRDMAFQKQQKQKAAEKSTDTEKEQVNKDVKKNALKARGVLSRDAAAAAARAKRRLTFAPAASAAAATGAINAKSKEADPNPDADLEDAMLSFAELEKGEKDDKAATAAPASALAASYTVVFQEPEFTGSLADPFGLDVVAAPIKKTKKSVRPKASAADSKVRQFDADGKELNSAEAAIQQTVLAVLSVVSGSPKLSKVFGVPRHGRRAQADGSDIRQQLSRYCSSPLIVRAIDEAFETIEFDPDDAPYLLGILGKTKTALRFRTLVCARYQYLDAITVSPRRPSMAWLKRLAMLASLALQAGQKFTDGCKGTRSDCQRGGAGTAGSDLL